MKKSRYFTELLKSYLDEIDDLLTDSEGKSVLQKRLRDKRSEMGALLTMIEFSPEMVAVVFYEAFEFSEPSMMQKLVLNEPEFGDFPEWEALEPGLVIAQWAEPLIDQTRMVEGGDAFLVTCAGLEFLRDRDLSSAPVQQARDDEDEDDDDETDDLGEAGSEWLSEQGFDTPDQ